MSKSVIGNQAGCNAWHSRCSTCHMCGVRMIHQHRDCTRELDGLRINNMRQQSASRRNEPLQLMQGCIVCSWTGCSATPSTWAPAPWTSAPRSRWPSSTSGPSPSSGRRTTCSSAAAHCPAALQAQSSPCIRLPVDVPCRRTAACGAHTANATCRYLNTHDVSDSVITMMIGYHDRRHQVLAWHLAHVHGQKCHAVLTKCR